MTGDPKLDCDVTCSGVRSVLETGPGRNSREAFGQEFDMSSRRILCRGENIGERDQTIGRRQYDGRWWEYQANLAMGTLLLPRPLVIDCLNSMLVEQGSLGGKTLPITMREEAVQKLTDVFDVNPIVGQIRLQGIFPVEHEQQLTL